jgi:hypothetical protein
MSTSFDTILKPQSQQNQALETLHGIYRTDVYDPHFQNLSIDPDSGYFCYTGYITQQPDIILGTACSPTSYTDARSRFLLTVPEYWNPGTNPFKPVINPAGTLQPNDRGGVIIEQAVDCSSKTFLQCLTTSAKESIGNASAGGTGTVLHLGVFIVFFFIAMMISRQNYGLLKSLRKQLKI